MRLHLLDARACDPMRYQYVLVIHLIIHGLVKPSDNFVEDY